MRPPPLLPAPLAPRAAARAGLDRAAGPTDRGGSRRAALMGLTLLAACDPPPAEVDPQTLRCATFRDEDTLPSSTQTFSVAVDPARGRAVATGLGLPWLSVVDLGSATRVDALRHASTSTRTPHVVLDGAGTAWVASASQPALVRVDVDARTVDEVAGLEPLQWAAGLDVGVVVSSGGAVVRLDTTGAIVATAAGGPARAGAVHPLGVVVVDGDQARLLDAASLATVGGCALAFAPTSVAALDDGSLVYADLTHLGRQVCTPDAVAETWAVGREVHTLVAGGDHVLALDRVGADDPTRGVAIRVGTTGAPSVAFATAKNTASGGYDADGVLWAAAEGSSEVVGFDGDGGVRAEVSTGTSLADLVVGPGGEVYGTGRLSALVGRRDGDVLLRAEPLVWPWAPRLDGDRLVLLDHLLGHLVALDAATLTETARVDLGLGVNELLTFDSLAQAPDRGTWLVAESQSDVVLEVDLDAGGVLRSWALGGPAVTDPDQGAQLELHYRGDGTAFLARTYDGRLTRLDLDGAELEHAWLDEADAALLLERRLTRALVPDGDTVWVGPHRIDPDGLERLETWDAIEAVSAPWPGAPGEWAAVSADGLALLHVDADGAERARYAWTAEPEPGTVMVPDPDGAAFWVNRSYEGLACRVPLTAIDAGRTRPPDP